MQTWAEETTDLNSCCWLLILRSALVSNREELEQALRVSLPILQPITYKKRLTPTLFFSTNLLGWVADQAATEWFAVELLGLRSLEKFWFQSCLQILQTPYCRPTVAVWLAQSFFWQEQWAAQPLHPPPLQRGAIFLSEKEGGSEPTKEPIELCQ